MTDTEILKKVIAKAQKNGWYPDTKFQIVALDGSIGTSLRLYGEFNDDGNRETFHREVETLIYQPYFAKAFWSSDYEDDLDEGYGYRIPYWKLQLQQMVIQEDPIKYLEQFLEKGRK